ncbi:MAG: hypothetical protein IJ335_09270 [Lachnospiraceae bacterium]|nr:hypothetical protein [Lachnospiraceae bacterium]
MISKREKGSRIAYWIGAAMVLAVLCGLWFVSQYRDTSRQQGVEVLLLGDSILAQSTVGELLADMGPYQVVNCAIGGTMLSAGQNGQDTEIQDMKNTLSMVALTEGICAGDFGAQKATRATEAVLNYLPATVATLESISLDETKVLIFNHGVNDYHRAVIPERTDAPGDIHTFAGAMRRIFADLREEYPELRIIYVTPPYAWYGEERIPCTEMDYGYGPLDNYVNLALELCREYQVEVVDIYHNTYDLTRADADKIYTLDGLHPSNEGSTLIAQRIAQVLGTE